MASIDRREFLKVPLGAGLAVAAGTLAAGAAGPQGAYRSFRLDNGFTTHVVEGDFGYTSAVLSLRSDRITADDGNLAHIMEHTSFVGAAGHLSAPDIKERWKDNVQDYNASTSPGEIVWQAMFLSEHLPEVIELLALTSLQQKFDVATVEQERKVVLQELYADKFSTSSQASRELDQTIYGADHPMVRDTVDIEIRKALEPAERIAVELRALAEALRLPSNMDLYLLGDLRTGGMPLERLVDAHFGVWPRRQGTMLKIPAVPVTARYRRLTKHARDLTPPLAELELAWNTGVTLDHPAAPVLTVAAGYLNELLFEGLREESGDTYSPSAYFDPSDHAGICHILLSTTRDPRRVERKVFEVMGRMRKGVPDKELRRFRERMELSRRREKRQDGVLMDNMVQRTMYGKALADLDVQTITADQVRAAAAAWLPEYRGSYVRLAKIGKDKAS